MDIPQLLRRLSQLVAFSGVSADLMIIGMSHSEGLTLEPTQQGFKVTDCYGRFVELYEYMGVIFHTLNDGQYSNYSAQAFHQDKIRPVYMEVLDHLTAAV